MKRKIIGNMMINIVSVALPLVVLQLFVLPLLAGSVDENEYGIVVTIASFFSFCPATIGNVLNNIRLIYGKERTKQEGSTDFCSLLLVCLGLNCIITVCYIGLSYSFDVLRILVIVLTSAAWLAQSYGVVSYLLKLDYRGVLLNNVAMAFGYLVGLGLCYGTARWELIYFCGQAFSLFYIFLTTGILKEKPRITPFFRSALRESTLLGASSLMLRLSTYSDRMILLPLMGGAAVSVYYVSTLLAKIVSMLSSSISNVMLSHLASRGKEKTKDIWTVMLVGLIVCCISYVIVLAAAEPCLNLLYPQFAEEAVQYLPITSLTAFVAVMFRLANPFLLCSLPMAWQLVISAISVVIYLGFALVLLNLYGLFGFCAGALTAESCKLLIALVLYKVIRVRN